jgi:integrase
VVNVDWNKEKPRVATLEPEQLRAWHKAVQTLSPIRRDYYLFLLFTGLRRTSAAEVRWEHVDWEAETVFIPKPKGGEDRAFKLPLSDFLMTLLKRRQEENTSIFPGSPWVFPTQDRKGRIRPLSEPKEYVELKEEAPATYRNGKPKLDRRGRPIMAIRVVRDEQGRAKKIRRPGMELGYPHALRHSYADYALAAGVGLTDIKFLMNHRNRDITESYMKGLMVALKPLQQKITDYILNTLEPRDTKGNVRKLVTAG